MRADRLTSYRQKLRRSLDAFEFGALIEGVSTLEEPKSPALTVLQPDSAVAPPSLVLPIPAETSKVLERPVLPPVASGANGQQALLPLVESTPTLDFDQPAREDRLRVALEEMTCCLYLELARMASALSMEDIGQAGEELARVNQLLDLIGSVDPRGDVARDLAIPGAPPAGRRWPSAAWSVVEFADSPLSGLLPASADEEFARKLLYEAWGVVFGDGKSS